MAGDARDQMFETMERGVADGVFPGASALVWRDGARVYDEAHGELASHSWSAVMGQAVTRETVYDLASLTKVLATTTLAAQLVSSGRLSLDDLIPEPWNASVPDATLADLLEHASGLAAHREYFTTVEPFDAEQVLHHVVNTPREEPRRTRAVYSDLGFIILGAWLERLIDKPLDQAFEDLVCYRLGLDATPLPGLAYRRHFSEAALKWDLEGLIAPTEVYDAALHPDGVPSHFAVRESTRIAHGTVHDDNAWVMGGVAGHAGLFGTANGVLEVGVAWLEGRVPDVDADTRDRFWRASTVSESTRRLGWDGTNPDGSGATGDVMSAHAVGHTGYTGTSLWIDPPSRTVCAMLTNRVHPTREGDAIKAFRREFHRAAMRLR